MPDFELLQAYWDSEVISADTRTKLLRCQSLQELVVPQLSLYEAGLLLGVADQTAWSLDRRGSQKLLRLICQGGDVSQTRDGVSKGADHTDAFVFSAFDICNQEMTPTDHERVDLAIAFEFLRERLGKLVEVPVIGSLTGDAIELGTVERMFRIGSRIQFRGRRVTNELARLRSHGVEVVAITGVVENIVEESNESPFVVPLLLEVHIKLQAKTNVSAGVRTSKTVGCIRGDARNTASLT